MNGTTFQPAEIIRLRQFELYFMAFRYLRLRPGKERGKDMEGVGQGLSWRYHPGICLVWLRENPGKTSVWMVGRWDWTHDLPNATPTLYHWATAARFTVSELPTLKVCSWYMIASPSPPVQPCFSQNDMEMKHPSKQMWNGSEGLQFGVQLY